MDPQQELFSLLLISLKEEFGDIVFDGELPPEGTPYPFIYLGESHQTDIRKKGIIIGNVFQTVSVWHDNTRQRGTVSQTLLKIKQIARKIRKGKYYNWDLTQCDQRILPDDTTDTPLLHGVLELEFTFNR